jgi:serine/threonine protein kinase
MSDHDPLIGKQLGDYKITGVLGQGGMARVYRGYDDKLERYAAVKVFDSRGVTSEEMKEYSERFQREARAIARLRHPHIVNVYQSGQSENIYYMAMMFIEGRDLRQIMKDHANAGTRMSFHDILRVITDVASGLDYAHKEGVIHRDVKPSNIMVGADGHAILTDFGLALSVPEGTLGTTFGSVHYIAPEQAVSSAQAVPQSDLYSLGVVLYEMLSGRVPFDDASAMSVALKHLSDPPPPPSLYNPQVTPQIEAMVLKSLDKDPAKRYQTGAAFIKALEDAFGMTDLDEATRKLMFAPEWIRATAEFGGVKPDPKPSATIAPSSPSSPFAASRPQPIISVHDNDKTISEKSAPGKLPQTAPRRNNVWNLAIVGIVLLVVVGGALLLSQLNTSSNSGSVTPTAGQSTSVAVVATTETSPAIVVGETDEVTAEVTDEPSPTRRATAVQTTEVSSVVDSTEEATATRTPTATRTVAPTRTPTATPKEETTPEVTEVVAVDSNAQLRLIYDDRTLVVLNQSDEPIDLTNMSFLQTTATGSRLQLFTSVWGDGTAQLYALPPGDCFQVWRNDQTTLPVPEECDTRHAWIAVSSQRWFWLSDIEQATFNVLRGSDVLAECRVTAGECLVNVAEDETSST